MRIIILTLFGFLTFQFSFAQNEIDTANKTQFTTFSKLYFGTLMGKDTNENPKADFRIGGAGGVVLYDFLETGLGVDILIYDNFTNLAPYIHVAYSPLQNSAIRPFVEANLGYNFVIESQYQSQYFDEFRKTGSIYSSTGLGIRIMSKNSNYIAISGGFNYAKNTIEYQYQWSGYKEKISENFNRYYLSFTFGF